MTHDYRKRKTTFFSPSCFENSWLKMAASRPISLPSVFISLWLLNGWIYLFNSIVQCLDEFEGGLEADSFLCRQCGNDIVGPSNLRNIPSPYALGQRNDTLLGVQHILIQLLENPSVGYNFKLQQLNHTFRLHSQNGGPDNEILFYSAGAKFEIISAMDVNLLGVSYWYSKDTWFPEYAWQIGVCPRCGRHLGWSFAQIDDLEEEQTSMHHKPNFTALILERLVHQNFADNLLITSKMYRA